MGCISVTNCERQSRKAMRSLRIERDSPLVREFVAVERGRKSTLLAASRATFGGRERLGRNGPCFGEGGQLPGNAAEFGQFLRRLDVRVFQKSLPQQAGAVLARLGNDRVAGRTGVLK